LSSYEVLSRRYRSLKFNNIAGLLSELITQAEQQELSYFQFAELLVDKELSAREINRRKLYLKRAKFPCLKSLEEFDFRQQTTISKKQINRLLDFNWIDNRENLVFFGPSGIGKSHLAIGIGLKAVNAGYKVLFMNFQDLIEYLDLGLAQNALKERIKLLVKNDLLILDELGYLPLNKKSVYNIFQLVNSFYETRSIIVTANKDFTQWGEFFIDETSATAIVDRLIHHCHIFAMGGESYRLKQQMERQSRFAGELKGLSENSPN